MVSSSPSLQRDVGLNLIVAKVVTSDGGKQGQRQEAPKAKAFKKPNWPNLNMIFWFFFCMFCFQKFYHYIQVSIMKIKQKSNLKK